MKLLREESRQVRAWPGTAGAAFSPACHGPFVTLSFQTSGLVYACSRRPSALVGDVHTQSLREIWDGPLLAGLSGAIAADRFDHECLACGRFAQRGMHEAADDRRYRHFVLPDAAPPFPRRLEFNSRIAGAGASDLPVAGCGGLVLVFVVARRSLCAGRVRLRDARGHGGRRVHRRRSPRGIDRRRRPPATPRRIFTPYPPRAVERPR